MALVAVAELFARCMSRRIAFNAGSLSLMVHLHVKTSASLRVIIRIGLPRPGRLASNCSASEKDIRPCSLCGVMIDRLAGDRNPVSALIPVFCDTGVAPFTRAFLSAALRRSAAVALAYSIHYIGSEFAAVDAP
jgi:hypothetical protein